MSELALVPSGRTIRWLDVASIVIVIGFAGLGLFAGMELWDLARVHRGLLSAATGLESTGRAIASLAGLPLVGDAIFSGRLTTSPKPLRRSRTGRSWSATAYGCWPSWSV